MLWKIVLYACLLALVICEGTIDFTYTTCEPGIYVKEKRVSVTYDYILSQNRVSQFNDMFIEFNLDEPQWVFIKYHISMRFTNPYYFQTHLLIDGNPNGLFFVESHNTYVSTHSAGNEVYL